ncbi:ribonuclease domain-containing protein [Actinokineospora sp. NPDC004072]
MLALLGALLSTLVAPAAATVYPTCAVAGCDAARIAYVTWRQLGFPTARGWYPWPQGQYNFAGGRFYNREGQLPTDHTFYEYDTHPRPEGAQRDARRIVRDVTTGDVWYSPNHYSDFYLLT